jgi:hypothetical protein
MLGPKPLRDVKLKFTSKDSEVWIAPYRAVSMFELTRTDAFDDKFAGDAIFLQCRRIAEGCALTIPFAVFRHGYLLH